MTVIHGAAIRRQELGFTLIEILVIITIITILPAIYSRHSRNSTRTSAGYCFLMLLMGGGVHLKFSPCFCPDLWDDYTSALSPRLRYTPLWNRHGTMSVVAISTDKSRGHDGSQDCKCGLPAFFSL